MGGHLWERTMFDGGISPSIRRFLDHTAPSEMGTDCGSLLHAVRTGIRRQSEAHAAPSSRFLAGVVVRPKRVHLSADLCPRGSVGRALSGNAEKTEHRVVLGCERSSANLSAAGHSAPGTQSLERLLGVEPDFAWAPGGQSVACGPRFGNQLFGLVAASHMSHCCCCAIRYGSR